ncbi:hypothetical protein Pint_13713 [Pistacia integerrima]|uniref:Uncharacterized protein n=1 Tax=Pistacia integerrima TaxID=434235 RepID=A0ACC0YAS3_9ROSI|nr:hypothetical protein Pint_13713 [Pistacia integerrima]
MERTQDYLRYCLQIAQDNGLLELMTHNKQEQHDQCLLDYNTPEVNASPQMPTPLHPHSDLAALVNQAKINGWYINPNELMGACLDPPNHGWVVTQFLTMTLKEWLHGPEVIRCEPYNEKSDVYSFGIILNELLTGNHPYIETDYGPTRIAMEVGGGTLRPALPENSDGRLEELKDLICILWDGDASARPSFSSYNHCFKKDSKQIYKQYMSTFNCMLKY